MLDKFMIGRSTSQHNVEYGVFEHFTYHWTALRGGHWNR